MPLLVCNTVTTLALIYWMNKWIFLCFENEYSLTVVNQQKLITKFVNFCLVIDILLKEHTHNNFPCALLKFSYVICNNNMINGSVGNAISEFPIFKYKFCS